MRTARVTATFTLLVLSVCSHGADNRYLEEIIVTAEKVEASAQDTAIAVTALDHGFIADFGVDDPEDIALFVPSFSRTELDFTIRGVGRTFRALGGDPGVGTYYNGQYVEDAFLSTSEGNLFDVERIEILRGPQGTLYGRNSIGGVVNIVTRSPTSTFDAELVTGFGNHNLEEYYGFVSGPLIRNTLNARLSATRTWQGADRPSRAVPGIRPVSDTGGVSDASVALTL